MASIRHFPATHPLPDWRNLGVILRVMLGTNLLAAMAALVLAPDLFSWPARCLDLAAVVEPLMLLTLGVLVLARDVLRRLPLRLGQLGVVVLVGWLALILSIAGTHLGLATNSGRAVLLSMLTAALLIAYFELRARAAAPAQTEARLAALNARIRPHFLFNSLNTVLSLMRARPQQAEAALESLADLFRAAMRDPGARSSLADEIELSQQYLELERLRLGERLQVDWEIGNVPLDLAIPPLLLQPLLENAVYHGIEPLPEGGRIGVGIHADADELTIVVHNPVGAANQHGAGNQMALANIRERLALYYDLEARLEIRTGKSFYEISMTFPCRKFL